MRVQSSRVRSSVLRWVAVLLAACSATAEAAVGPPEKEGLKLGFIKLTDMAPLAIAYEKGYFEDEGLYVTLEAQSNWKVLFDGVISGVLDGAHMLAPMPLAAATGVTTSAEVIAPLTLSYNGAAITVASAVWAEMKPNVAMADGKPVHPISAAALKPVVESYRQAGKPFNLGMTFPIGTHNYLLRYWLAAGGIHPGYYAPAKGDNSGSVDAQALLSVVPPPQMVPTMSAGTTVGYCVGEPWNQQAVFTGLGVPVVTSENSGRTAPTRCSASPSPLPSATPTPPCAWSRPSSAPPPGWMPTTTPTVPRP
jgi:ABC-type nitrate/sulfonate/bicarbonate transport systems, periplasmic components